VRKHDKINARDVLNGYKCTQFLPNCQINSVKNSVFCQFFLFYIKKWPIPCLGCVESRFLCGFGAIHRTFVQIFAKNGLIVSSTKACGLFDKGNDTSSGKEWYFFEEGKNFL